MRKNQKFLGSTYEKGHCEIVKNSLVLKSLVLIFNFSHHHNNPEHHDDDVLVQELSSRS